LAESKQVVKWQNLWQNLVSHLVRKAVLKFSGRAVNLAAPRFSFSMFISLKTDIIRAYGAAVCYHHFKGVKFNY
jgi:hypothetical protein